MPFTFSHPAAVLPAKFLPKKMVSMTALIVGSMAPDFEYYIRMKALHKYGHSWVGLFWFDLPIAFVICFIYHRFVRDRLIDNLPGFLHKRLKRYIGFDWNGYVNRNFWVVVFCLIIGITTHLIWDEVTHGSGFVASIIPWLKVNRENQMRFYALQEISSLLGFAMVCFALLKIPKDESIASKSIYKYWLAFMSIALIISAVRIFGWLYHDKTMNDFVIHIYSGIPDLIIPKEILMTVISACLISLIVTPLINKFKN